MGTPGSESLPTASNGSMFAFPGVGTSPTPQLAAFSVLDSALVFAHMDGVISEE